LEACLLNPNTPAELPRHPTPELQCRSHVFHTQRSKSRQRPSFPRKREARKKNWIPGQARNDKSHTTYVVMYISSIGAAELRASLGIDPPEQNGIIHSAVGDIFVDGEAGCHRAAELQ
jgi:hypothetical protein